MAVQQLTQPILNPIAAFDATKEQTISFVVIGGAQVVANRLVIQDNQTGVEIYSNIESTLKLEHTIPANTLKNGGYYNAVVYTLDNSNTLSSPSTPVPFYCYTQPLLTITNIPATETIENGTYTFEGSYSQIEGELLNSYQFTLYDSNKEVLSKTPLIYYETDSSLSYTFVGMNNDTSYYIELSGQTLNNTSMSTGLLYFTVRYIQPASFAICDLVNDCKDGYVQISSNIVAIDGHSNPDPPIYIDDKEVDLRDPDSYVEWNSGFRIQDDFTMRAWGRDFNDYQNIITLTNDINTEETPNKIELKWMLGDVVKEQLSYEDINGELINVSDSVTAPIKNLEIYGNSIQVDRNADVYVEGKSTQEVQAESFKTATGNPVTITDGELDKPVKLGQIDGLSTQATRSGKNLAILGITSGTIDGVPFTVNKGIININGTTSSKNANYYFNSFRVSNSGIATFWIEVTGYIDKPSNNASVLLQESSDNSTWSTTKEISCKSTAQKQYQITLDNSKYYRIRFYTIENTFTNATIKIQLEYGTNKTEFEEAGASPSPEFPSEIKSVGDEGTVTIEHRGKNLFDASKIGNTDIVVSNNGQTITMPIATRANGYTTTNKKLSELCPSLKVGDKVILRFNTTSAINKYIHLSGITYTWVVNKELTITEKALNSYVILYANNYSGGETEQVTITDMSIMLSNEINIDYEPYFSKDYVIPLSAPLRSLPKGTKDILNNKGITRRVGKIVLNGSENWEGFISSYKNTIRAQVLISDMHNIGNNVGLNIMSSHFLPKDLYVHDIVGIEHIHNQLFIRINKYDLDEISLNGFKAWLAAHPTEVIYELATAQNESYEGQTPSPDTPSPIISVGDVKNLIDVPDFNVDYNQQYYQDTNTNFLLKPNYTYTLSFDFNINKSSTDLYYSLGYGTDRYVKDITKTTIYSTQTKGRNKITFTVPADIPDNSYLWVRFARTIILADINIDISNIQLEKGKEDTGYQPTTDYNIYLTVSSKNLFDYDNPLYIRTNNLNYNEISNGYHMSPISVGENTEFTIGIENCFNEGDIYALSFSQLGEFGYVAMYKTLKGTQERIDIIDLTNNIFTAPSQNYDLELVFSMSSSALSNSLEIWSIQIEANNTQTTYETHEENSSIITLDTPLNRIGDYADWVGNISPNLLNPVTGSAIVEENTDYFYNKKSTYTASVTIQYKNADGNVISSETLTNDSTISTPENCVEIHIEGLNEQAIKTNHLQIRKGNSNKPYLPYITEPSLIKVTGKIVLDGSDDENWLLSLYNFFYISVDDITVGTNRGIHAISSHFIAVDYIDRNNYTTPILDLVNLSKELEFRNSGMITMDEWKTWLSTHNTEVIYVLEEPKIIPLSSLNSEALKALETYEPISNVYTNNKLLGTLDLDYANGKDMKEVQNAYVLLKCWNGNKMPYVIHSNYIDIPESTENIFIWMRRKKNIFDLRIENLTKGD